MRGRIIGDVTALVYITLLGHPRQAWDLWKVRDLSAEDAARELSRKDTERGD